MRKTHKPNFHEQLSASMLRDLTKAINDQNAYNYRQQRKNIETFTRKKLCEYIRNHNTMIEMFNGEFKGYYISENLLKRIESGEQLW